MEQLHAWLCRNIPPIDFARVVDLSDGFGLGRERLRAALPPECVSCAEYYYRCLRILEQHGLLERPHFFSILADERPLRAREVRALAQGIASATTAHPVEAGVASRALRRRTLAAALALLGVAV